MSKYLTITVVGTAVALVILQVLIYKESSRASCSSLDHASIEALKADVVITTANAADPQLLRGMLQSVVAAEIDRALSATAATVVGSTVSGVQQTSKTVNGEGGAQAFLDASSHLERSIMVGAWTFDDYAKISSLTSSMSIKQRDQLAERFAAAVNSQQLDLGGIIKNGVPFAF